MLLQLDMYTEEFNLKNLTCWDNFKFATYLCNICYKDALTVHWDLKERLHNLLDFKYSTIGNYRLYYLCLDNQTVVVINTDHGFHSLAKTIDNTNLKDIDKVITLVSHMTAKYHNLCIVGHSIAGLVAAIVADHMNVPAITIGTVPSLNTYTLKNKYRVDFKDKNDLIAASKKNKNTVYINSKKPLSVIEGVTRNRIANYVLLAATTVELAGVS